jgi:poly-beta-1,6-N-acetyl-D-glucosamine synthase
VYRAIGWGLAAMCLVGVAGMAPAIAGRLRIASAFGSFLVLNAAAWFAFWVWVFGRSARSWTKVTYAGQREGVVDC